MERAIQLGKQRFSKCREAKILNAQKGPLLVREAGLLDLALVGLLSPRVLKYQALAVVNAPRSAASFSVENASIKSPSFRSLKPLRPMPHSMPLVTSRASSLK